MILGGQVILCTPLTNLGAGMDVDLFLNHGGEKNARTGFETFFQSEW